MTYSIPSEVIAAATQGRILSKTLVSWNERGKWATQLQPAERGKPRLYSYANALEAVLADAMIRLGMTREAARLTIERRCAAVRETATGYTLDATARLPELSEWGMRTCWWGVICDTGLTTHSIEAFSDSGAAGAWLAQSQLGGLMIPVCAAKARLDEVLNAAGMERD